MHIWQTIFTASLLILFYNYAGYACILSLINIFKKQTNNIDNNYFPSVTFIVAAYNEEDFIEKKIINTLEQNYPKELLEIIFITDGSNDNTTSIVSSYKNIRCLYRPERNGKTAALNRAVEEANNDILIFSDANTTLNKNAIAHISRHYNNSKIGGVAGEKRVIDLSNKSTIENSEGLYWKYESLLKKNRF